MVYHISNLDHRWTATEQEVGEKVQVHSFKRWWADQTRTSLCRLLPQAPKFTRAHFMEVPSPFPTPSSYLFSNAHQKLNTLFSYADEKRLPIILLLDEVGALETPPLWSSFQLDFLVNKNQTVIYTMFNFASSPDSRLAIISITNTFDFCSRLLDSRIQSRIVRPSQLLSLLLLFRALIVYITNLTTGNKLWR